MPVGETVFCDRSPPCTLALSRFLGIEPPTALLAEIGRLRMNGG